MRVAQVDSVCSRWLCIVHQRSKYLRPVLRGQVPLPEHLRRVFHQHGRHRHRCSCKADHYLHIDTCVARSQIDARHLACLDGCLSCRFDTICDNCRFDRHLFDGICQQPTIRSATFAYDRCVDQKCIACINGRCQKCEDGWYLDTRYHSCTSTRLEAVMYGYVDDRLVACVQDGCISCRTAIDRCEQCGTGWYIMDGACHLITSDLSKKGIDLSKQMTLAACVDSHCSKCTMNHLVCSQCDSGYVLYGQLCISNETRVDRFGIEGGKELKACLDAKCLDCHANNSRCIVCEAEFVLVVDQFSCVAKNTVISRYGFDEAKTSLHRCQVSLCLECSFYKVCDKCEDGHKVFNNVCMNFSSSIDHYGNSVSNTSHFKRCSDEKCLVCTGDVATCERCEADYSLLSRRRCLLDLRLFPCPRRWKLQALQDSRLSTMRDERRDMRQLRSHPQIPYDHRRKKKLLLRHASRIRHQRTASRRSVDRSVHRHQLRAVCHQQSEMRDMQGRLPSARRLTRVRDRRIICARIWI